MTLSNSKIRTLIVIPLRLKSKRLPGKILKKIGSQSLAQKVCLRALKLSSTSVAVIAAVDSLKTKKELEALAREDLHVVMTPEKLASGSDRVWWAAKAFLKKKKIARSKIKAIVNLQGDMPFFWPKAIERGIEETKKLKGAQILTLSCPWPQNSNPESKSKVKVVFDNNKRALYFSRFPIPCSKRIDPKLMQLHIGVYAYTPSALEAFCKAKAGLLEKQEGLEQLRAMQIGIPIQVLSIKAPASYSFRGIDVAADLSWASSFAK